MTRKANKQIKETKEKSVQKKYLNSYKNAKISKKTIVEKLLSKYLDLLIII